MNKIKILIVDDSPTETAILKKLFEAEKDMQVIACANNGKEGVELANSLKPDLITMDIEMPVMDGYEATRLIMSQNPRPIVVISSKAKNAAMNTTYLALEAGALSVLGKPFNIASAAFERERKRIIDTLRNMAQIRVIKRKFLTKQVAKNRFQKPTSAFKNVNYEIVVIGTSVGGPEVLRIILGNLPADFPVPILIVQHMTPGFISGFATWLNENIKLNVKEAEHKELLLKGTVYFAPDNYHLEVSRTDDQLTANLSKGAPVAGFCPSATVLINSVAEVCGKNAIGMLLTGMGSDGAHGLLALKKAQGHTLIQDPDSTVVFGMGGVAQALGAVDKVIEMDKIAGYLIGITKKDKIVS